MTNHWQRIELDNALHYLRKDCWRVAVSPAEEALRMAMFHVIEALMPLNDVQPETHPVSQPATSSPPSHGRSHLPMDPPEAL